MRLGGVRLIALIAITASVCGCATPPPASDPEALAEYRENNDPLEPANRALYAVHDKIDTHVTAPIARGYRDWVPSTVRSHLLQFADNVASPVQLSNDMLQAKPRRAGDTLMRLLINSTIGVGGIFARSWSIRNIYRIFPTRSRYGAWVRGRTCLSPSSARVRHAASPSIRPQFCSTR